MRFSQSRIGTTAILALFVAASAGCSLVNKLRAKSELNDSAQAYREGHIEEAEQHAKRALYLDPDNPTAPIFVARIIHQQYKQGVDTQRISPRPKRRLRLTNRSCRETRATRK